MSVYCIRIPKGKFQYIFCFVIIYLQLFVGLMQKIAKIIAQIMDIKKILMANKLPIGIVCLNLVKPGAFNSTTEVR